jgi:hypothetical protein
VVVLYCTVLYLAVGSVNMNSVRYVSLTKRQHWMEKRKHWLIVVLFVFLFAILQVVLYAGISSTPSVFGIRFDTVEADGVDKLRAQDVNEITVRDGIGSGDATNDKNVSNANTLVSALPPVAMMDQYIKWHSVESIERNPHNRTFAIAYYACPLQAGNRMHHYMNDLMLAMATNRTMLWKYWDRESCLQLGSKYDQSVCRSSAMSTEEDCNGILRRASWMPSYTEWKDKLGLPATIEVFDGGMSDAQLDSAVLRVPWVDDVTGRHGPAVDWPIVAFHPNVGVLKSQSQVAGQDVANKYFLDDKWASSVLSNLFHFGGYFMYGMMFHRSFSFTEKVLASVSKTPAIVDGLSLAVHSRHADPEDDGSDVHDEIQCLQRLISNSSRYCQVYIMSDRRKTLSALRRLLRSKNCSCVEAEHDKGGSFENEHGPFAGIGFFQDLLVASQARSGYVGYMRSSSKLLYEWIEYFRLLEYTENGHDMSALSPSYSCLLSEKKKKKMMMM